MSRSVARLVKRGLAAAVLVLALSAALLLWPRPAVTPAGAWMAQTGVTPEFETVAGVRVRYVRLGRGPGVLLLHGIASSIYTWNAALPELARRHEVVAMDLPGFGGSEVPRDFGAALYPRVVLALLDRLHLGRVSVAGNSLGGAVAVALAAESPERVASLVLIDSAGFNLAVKDRPWLLRMAGSKPVANALEALPLVRRPLVVLGLRQVFHNDRLVTAERVQEYLAPMARPGVVGFMHRLLSSGDPFGFPEVLTRVRAPTLILWGEEDAWVPPSDARRFADAIPGARVVTLPGCGHVPQEECPAQVTPLLQQFLDDHPIGGARN